MNNTIRTYGIIINMDYFHQSENKCREIWNDIIRSMRIAGFHFDKRMFLMTTQLDKQSVCKKARTALNNIDEETELYNKNTLDYITDFIAIDMSEYDDLRLPPLDLGIIINEKNRVSQTYSFN
ncbi:MAG: hypothetical protein OQL19_00610 [Gammaproteobacteria bacterium]|nr:hypothetical protein [Gammaproteobacteria bacterium]